MELKPANKILGSLFDVNSDFTFFNPNFQDRALRLIVNNGNSGNKWLYAIARG